MTPKRRIENRSPSLTDSESERVRKRIRSSSPFPEREQSSTLKIYIVQAKLDEKELQDLFRLIDDSQLDDQRQEVGTHFVATSNHHDADVIVTNLRMKKRFERHLPWTIAVRSRGLLFSFSFTSLGLFRGKSLSSPQLGFVNRSKMGALHNVDPLLHSEISTTRLHPITNQYAQQRSPHYLSRKAE